MLETYDDKTPNERKLEELQAKVRRQLDRLKEIRALDGDKLTSEIREERDQKISYVETLKAQIDKLAEEDPEIARKLAPFQRGSNIPADRETRGGNGYRLIGPNGKKDFRSAFGSQPLNSHQWQSRDIDFFRAAFSGRHHPGLETRAMIEGVMADGGFLVPVEYAEQIHNVALENEIVFPRSNFTGMKSNEKHIPAFEIGDHSSNLFGGFVAYRKPETGTLTQANPKARDIVLKATKLTGFLRISNELARDMSGGEQQIIDICGKGLAWYRDKEFLKGSGAGEPLGILNAPCTIEVAKSDGQAADTITYVNLVTMLSRLWSGSFQNAVWLAHPTTIPQLCQLSIDIGDSGAHIPVMKELASRSSGIDGNFSILTRPVIFTEKMEPLGDRGDIALCDFSQYVIGAREEMRFDTSQHLYFNTDEMAARLIQRNDGMPLWDEALTLEDGSTTVSPFVVLAERGE